MRRWRRDVEFLHYAAHRVANSGDIIVRDLALDRCGIVCVSAEWRRRPGIDHDVLRFAQQLVDVLKCRAHMALMMFAETMRICFPVHAQASGMDALPGARGCLGTALPFVS